MDEERSTKPFLLEGTDRVFYEMSQHVIIIAETLTVCT